MKNLSVLAVLLTLLFLTTSIGAGGNAGDKALIAVGVPDQDAVHDLFASDVSIVRNLGRFALMIADQKEQARLRELGFSLDILDVSTEGQTYYSVFPARGLSVKDITSRVRVLKSDLEQAVVACSPSDAEALAADGFEIAKVFMRPVRPPRQFGPPPQRFFIQTDSLIQTMVDQVSSASVDAYVKRLQDFKSRWARHDSCQAAADFIKAEFESFGIDSVNFHHFSSFYKDNVVAVLPGLAMPDKVMVIGGHYDTVSSSPDLCPGADDNASGTACVLECARILSQYEFDYTLIFIAFGAEEQGLLGSEAYAAEASARGDSIMAMINVDMIGYLETGDAVDLDIVDNVSSVWLRNRVMDVAAMYVPDLPLVDGYLPGGAGSDHMSFWAHGYDAIGFFEDTDQWSPYIHSAADTIGLSYNSSTLAHRSIKTAVALLADLAQPRPLPTGIPDEEATGISDVVLEQNVPNPFNPNTMIRFSVPSPGTITDLEIFDVAGRKIRTLLSNELVTGTREVWWDGRNNGGNRVASGVYLYRLRADDRIFTRKLVLVR